MQAMELRKVCNHPFLCNGLEDSLLAKYGHKQVSLISPFCYGNAPMLKRSGLVDSFSIHRVEMYFVEVTRRTYNFNPILFFWYQGQSHVPANILQSSSGKMVLVDKLLPKLKDSGRRVLIFSQVYLYLKSIFIEVSILLAFVICRHSREFLCD